MLATKPSFHIAYRLGIERQTLLLEKRRFDEGSVSSLSSFGMSRKFLSPLSPFRLANPRDILSCLNAL